MSLTYTCDVCKATANAVAVEGIAEIPKDWIEINFTVANQTELRERMMHVCEKCGQKITIESALGYVTGAIAIRFKALRDGVEAEIAAKERAAKDRTPPAT